MGPNRHTLTQGIRRSGDVELDRSHVRKGDKFLSTVSHTYTYTARDNEEITAVVAEDQWSDDTGGNPELIYMNRKEVTIEVTSQRNRGFNFIFYVYGIRKSTVAVAAPLKHVPAHVTTPAPPAPTPAAKPNVFDEKPTLKLLTLIKWKDGMQEHQMKIIGTVCNKWEMIGAILGIPYADLQSYKQISPDPEKCCNSVFRSWLQNPPEDYPLTWGGCLALLKDVDFNELAKELKEALTHRV